MIGFSVYSDGSSTGRAHGPGGWGFVILFDGEVIWAGSGGARDITNNIAELMGAIDGLEKLITLPIFKDKGPTQPLELVCDSQYVLGLANGSYSPSKNHELASKIKELCRVYRVTTRWVRGHSGEEVNEICDSLANHGKQQFTPAKVLKRQAKKALKTKKDKL
jgi:ribonuclease HI